MGKEKSGVGSVGGQAVRLRTGSDSATSVSQLLSLLGSLSPRTSDLRPSPTCKKLLTCGLKVRQQEEISIVSEIRKMRHLFPK